jgi:hypothetical protein
LPGPRNWWIPLALIPIAVLLGQFRFSDALWNLLPKLRFLQFPWRWLLILEAPIAIFLAAALWPQTIARRHRIFVIVACPAIFICLTAAASKYLYQACYPEDTVARMLSVLRVGQGYNGTSEYEPLGADISRIPMGLPQACLVSDPHIVLGTSNADGELVWDASQGSCEAIFAAGQNSRPEHLRIDGTVPRPGFLILRQLTYPAWRLKLNGQLVLSKTSRQDGLTTVPVPQGAFELSVDWTTTRDVMLARWLSGLSVFALTLICLLERKLKRPRLSFEK